MLPEKAYIQPIATIAATQNTYISSCFSWPGSFSIISQIFNKNITQA
jgi:hypothetical protein